MTITLTQHDLDQFTGDLERYRHWLTPKVIYTPGVKYLASTGGAYWLIDEIVHALGSNRLKKQSSRDRRASEMLFWSLECKPGGPALLTAVVDAGEKPVFRKNIPWTDFPLDKVEIWCGFDGQCWTLYLPSEH